jgi:AcrR family transcriptional regulator
MSTRSVIIAASAELLAQSTSGDISTRAVCEAAGVQQPVIYRLFGDKEGLLAATVDHVWDEYLGMKRAAEASGDPLDDLKAGWDSHTTFAVAHPNAYRLLFGSGAVGPAESADEAMRLLRVVLDRLAAEGRLRVGPDEAARLIMAANTGVALALILRPSLYPNVALSTTMRDTVIGALLSDAPRAAEANGPARLAAITLRNTLSTTPSPLFTDREAGLLDEWLQRIQSSPHST